MRRDNLELAFDSLFVDKIKHTFTAADVDLLSRVYAFSREKACVREPTAFQAANLLIEQDADAIMVACALLAPLLWQNVADTGDIREHFGPVVAATLEDLSFSSIYCSDTRQCLRQDVNNILNFIDGVPRKALLFITFRLLALENATYSDETVGRKMAQDTLNLLVPIANRLSLGDLRSRLEDACFYILDPAVYESLKEKVAPIQAEDDKCLEILLAGVRRLLDNNGFQGCVQGRTKSLYGIRRKMIRTGKNLEEIMDRVALRVIVTSVPKCYKVLGLLHTHFKPISGTFDDYIGLPKDNGYQSLHTCVYPVREISHKPIEFQVRTELMHMEAKHGTAAHWRYKSETVMAERNQNQAQWMEGLAHQHKQVVSTEAFIDQLYRQVFLEHLVVFGNGGRIVRLAEKATVYDYLNIAGIKIPECAVVKVNGKTVAMDRSLRDGDSIEVVTGDGSTGHQTTYNVMKNKIPRIGALYSFAEPEGLDVSSIRSSP